MAGLEYLNLGISGIFRQFESYEEQFLLKKKISVEHLSLH